MKPNFALSLSSEGICLLHRAAGGWREVGEVSVDSADLADELAVLRKTAASLEPGGVRSKLMIPDSQIKYLTIDTPGLSDAARRKAAETALRDATPYEISELSYDICADGAKTHVAAVARETLAEAEAFALEHRFHPVSFVAVPGDADYLGEPFFGVTKSAQTLLEPNEDVEPDGIAVVVVGAVAPLPPVASEPVIEPDVPQVEDAPQESAKLPVEDVIKSPTQASADPQTQDEVVVETPSPKSEPAAPETPAATAVAAIPETPKNTVPETKDTGAAEKVDTAPLAVSPPRKPTLSATKPVAAPTSGPKIEATGFSSRRASAQPQGAAKPLGSAPTTTPPPDSSSLVQTKPAPAAPPAKTGFFSRRKPRTGAAAPMPAPTSAVPAAGSETERMTVFGARTDQVGGKPRYLGLIMTVVLLVFLAGVAAWAAVFVEDGIAGLIKRDPPRATASAPENQIGPEIIRASEGEEPAAAEDSVQIAALDPVLSAEDTAVLDALQDPLPEPQRPVITAQEAAARYAVTGIWPLSPDTPLSVPATVSEPAFRSGIDPVSNANDAIALPAPTVFETDVELAAVFSPPPFGQTTQRDASGLIVPTPDGVVAPEGYTLVAASPPLKPPAVRNRLAAVPEDVAPILSALAAVRPSPRPLGLAERTERAQLGGVSRSELAAYRPSLRPKSVQDRAREAEDVAIADDEARAAAAAEAASAAAAAALALPPLTPTVQPAIQSATRFATAQSRRPDTRPRNFARIVKRAQRAAPAPTETRVAAAASVAPRSVAPKLPSKASVARSATVKNAINLRRVNLIGVYGKPSSRRALVRLSNGRYQKVSVGDRIDGGRVAAISNSELRYTKGGRNVVLKMP